MVELTKEEYNLIAEGRDIEKPLYMSTKKLLNTLNRYDSSVKVENYQK